jgi:hypothetical protein
MGIMPEYVHAFHIVCVAYDVWTAIEMRSRVVLTSDRFGTGEIAWIETLAVERNIGQRVATCG